MEKYIPLDALLAEIERLEKKNNESENVYDFGTEHALKSIRSFINTLKVKEVEKDCNITGIKSKHAEGKLKECIESITEESLIKARKQLDEESVSEEFRKEIEEYAMGRLRDPKLCLEYIYIELINAIKYGVNLQKEQFEKERLKHCDELTDEQAQIESDFVTQHLKENNRTPTFTDAIEYGMQLMHEKIMKGGVEGTVKFVNTGGDDPFVKFICPDLHSSEFRLNQRVKIIILKKEKL